MISLVQLMGLLSQFSPPNAGSGFWQNRLRTRSPWSPTHLAVHGEKTVHSVKPPSVKCIKIRRGLVDEIAIFQDFKAPFSQKESINQWKANAQKVGIFQTWSIKSYRIYNYKCFQ